MGLSCFFSFRLSKEIAVTAAPPHFTTVLPPYQAPSSELAPQPFASVGEQQPSVILSDQGGVKTMIWTEAAGMVSPKNFPSQTSLHSRHAVDGLLSLRSALTSQRNYFHPPPPPPPPVPSHFNLHRRSPINMEKLWAGDKNQIQRDQTDNVVGITLLKKLYSSKTIEWYYVYMLKTFFGQLTISDFVESSRYLTNTILNIFFSKSVVHNEKEIAFLRYVSWNL